MTKQNLPRLVVFDGNALIHRAFHALPPLTTKSGELVNAVYGFTTTLLRALKDFEPTYCVVTFDLPAPTFRHKKYKEYKATRVKADQSLYDQIPRVKEVVEALNIPIMTAEGLEADDVIATLATQAATKNIETVIVTGDLDTLQLVNPLIKVYTMRRGLTDLMIYDENAVKEKYGLKPDQMIDYKILRGDPSDNIPGIPGVGEKTASDLLQKFTTIEGIYAHLPELPERLRQTLEATRKQIGFNRQLVALVHEAPVELDLEKCTLHDYDRSKAVQLFQQLEFKSLMSRLPMPNQAKQGELFFTTPADKSLPFKIHLVTDAKALDQLVTKLDAAKSLVVDTETDFLDGNLIGLSLAVDDKQAWYVPCAHKNLNGVKNQLSKGLVLKKLAPILEKIPLPKGGHNIKYDYTILRRENIILQPLSFDTMVASYLLNPTSRNHNLDNVSFVELGYEKIPLTALIGPKKTGNLAEAPLEKVSRYSAEDAHTTFRLWQKLAPELKAHHLDKLFHDMEMPLVSVLGDMERLGIKLDTKYLAALSKRLQGRLKILEQTIYDQAGQTFNVNSPRQLADIIFNKLKLSSTEIRKGKTGLSTAAGELEKLRHKHPIIDQLLEYRELAKLLNTYIDALPKLVSPRDHRLHTSFNQAITATGRLSSSDPNLQNIPVRTDVGQEIRKAFIAEKGFELVSADYSQIELRIIADLAKDKEMMAAFRAGRDIHSETAKELGIARRMAKIVNFSIIYGTSSYGLSKALGIDPHEAQVLIDKYFITFAGISQYMANTINNARTEGYVATMFNRRRVIPEISSGNINVRQGAERAAINMPVQGTAADIMKMAMLKIADYFKELSENRARLLLQVHDELILEVAKDDVPKVAKKVKALMEVVNPLSIPLIAEVKSGPSWQDMAPIK